MSKISWLEIDGVRYVEQDDHLLCDTAVGFHSRLPGHTLDGLEISDAQGMALGYLNVDFWSGHVELLAASAGSELGETALLLADEQGVHQLSLDQLLVASSDWNANDELIPFTDFQPDAPSCFSSIPLTQGLETMVSDADETLDSLFGESDPAAPLAGLTLAPAVVSPDGGDLSYLYLTHGSEPVHMPLVPEYPDTLSSC